jgi:hypothetical protein
MKSDICSKYEIFVKFKIQFILSLTSSNNKSFLCRNKIQDQLPVFTFINSFKHKLIIVYFISYNLMILTDMTE